MVRTYTKQEQTCIIKADLFLLLMQKLLVLLKYYILNIYTQK